MFDNSPVRRAISLAVITSYLTLLSAPTAAAVKQEIFARPKPLTENSVSESELSRMREAVRRQALESRLRPVGGDGVVDKLKGLFGDSVAVKSEKALVASLLQARTRLQQEAAEQDKAMAATRADLVKKNLPATILARHDEAVKTLAARRAELMKDLSLLEVADKSGKDDVRRSSLEAVSKKIEQWGGESAVKTDYKHLPWGTPDSKVRAPRESKTAYLMNLEMFGIKPLQVAGPIPAGTVLPVLPNLGAAVQPADTAENEDVQLTQAIRDQAAALGHNPARIYKWVYDNIEFIPSYGSIQGADYTLQTKRGNSFDTSSLLIGLLRASNIPARYVYGTVEIPMDKVMNWVGGVTSPDAALSLLGQGGIPSIGITSAGQFKAVRLEHVWVEAYVDFVPSRGAKQKQSDTWVPMDAAFKQYTYTQPMNLQQAVPFDAQALVNQMQQGATIDEANGYVQNLNQSSIETALTNYQSQVKTYLEQQQPNATASDLLGSKVIQHYPSKMLAGTLQVKHVAVAGDFQTLPSTMRHYFNYTVYTDAQSRALGTSAIDQRLSFPFLAGKFLALSFKPATTQDEVTISSFLPEPHADGTPISPSELPQSLPGYLINLTPELTVDGEVIANTSQTMVMGHEVFTYSSVTSPNSSLSDVVTENRIVAGEYHAIANSNQGISTQELLRINEKIQGALAELEKNEGDRNITKHNLTGVMLRAAVSAYFAQVNIDAKLVASVNNCLIIDQPSYGSFSLAMSTLSQWGIPIKVASKGFVMDIDKLSYSIAKKDSFNGGSFSAQYQLGVKASANEHVVPEVLFSNGAAVGAISAVKALQLASLQGQVIRQITSLNINDVLEDLELPSDAISEIRGAVSAGKVVIVGSELIQYMGWTGLGYIILDPYSGSAAFKISGGANGGEMPAENLGPVVDGLMLAAVSGDAHEEELLTVVQVVVQELIQILLELPEKLTTIIAAIQTAFDIISLINKCGLGMALGYSVVAIVGLVFTLWVGSKNLIMGAIFGMVLAVLLGNLKKVIEEACEKGLGARFRFGRGNWAANKDQHIIWI